MEVNVSVRRRRFRLRSLAPLVFIVSLGASTSHFALAKGFRLLDEPSPAPALRLPALDGSTHDLMQYRGHAVILHFWATWCRPCLKEMADLQAAWGRLRQLDVQVLAVAVGDSAHDVRAFVAKTPIGFPLLLDTEKEAFGNWPAIAMPTTFLIDPGGRIVAKIVGPYEWNNPDHLRRLPLPHFAAGGPQDPPVTDCAMHASEWCRRTVRL